MSAATKALRRYNVEREPRKNNLLRITVSTLDASAAAETKFERNVSVSAIAESLNSRKPMKRRSNS